MTAIKGPEPYYQDDLVTLYHGNAVRVLPHLDPDDYAAMVTDPPYGISYRSNSRRDTLAASIAGDEDTRLRDAALEWWGDRPALVFGTWRVPRPAATRALLVWDTKGALGMGDLSLPWKPAHQEVYVLGRGFAGRRGTDVLTYAPVQSMARNGRCHPHQKPTSLMADLLAKCPAGAVIDPFAGSGSTLRAAKDAGRRAVGIELEEHYCEVIAQRLAQESFDLAGA
jgi:DNA modification methylase